MTKSDANRESKIKYDVMKIYILSGGPNASIVLTGHNIGFCTYEFQSLLSNRTPGN